MWGGENFLKIATSTFSFNEIALSRMVKEIEANLCFAIFENFLKIAKSTFLRYPMGKKFQRNNSILHG